LSDDNTLLLTASSYAGFTLWDIASNTPLFERPIDMLPITSIDIHPNGTAVLIAASDGESNTVQIWDVTSGDVLRDYPEHPAYITNAAFASDGHTVLVAASNTTYYPGGRIETIASLTEWRAEIFGDLLAWVRDNRFVRPFTCDERREFGIEPLCD
jgi:WD40 repeat protein